MYVFAQVLGVLAIICWVLSILQKDKKRILMCQTVANGIYGVEYYILNAFTASLTNFVSMVRCFIFFLYEKKKKKISKAILFLFVILTIIIGIITYDGIISIIPICIFILYTYSLWQDNMKIIRVIYIIAAVIWIYYNYQVTAYVSIVGNILEIISGFIALRRMKK